MVQAPLAEGIVGRAIERGVIDVRVHDLRVHTTDRHRVVDDVPFGGGPGMVLKPEPLFRAVEGIRAERGDTGGGHTDVSGRTPLQSCRRGASERRRAFRHPVRTLRRR